MHGRRSRTYDHRPSHPYNAGTEERRVFTDQADIGLRSALSYWARRKKGELHPKRARGGGDNVMFSSDIPVQRAA